MVVLVCNIFRFYLDFVVGCDVIKELLFFYREVYNAICPRLGHTLHIPEDSVQSLFNDMKLYPSKDQGKKKAIEGRLNYLGCTVF